MSVHFLTYLVEWPLFVKNWHEFPQRWGRTERGILGWEEYQLKGTSYSNAIWFSECYERFRDDVVEPWGEDFDEVFVPLFYGCWREGCGPRDLAVKEAYGPVPGFDLVLNPGTTASFSEHCSQIPIGGLRKYFEAAHPPSDFPHDKFDRFYDYARDWMNLLGLAESSERGVVIISN